MPRSRYGRPLAEYAQVYQTTDRAIKRWIRTGKDRGQLPPLDDPRTLVLSWWPFAMNHRAPAKLLEIAGRHPSQHATHDAITIIPQEKKCRTDIDGMAAPEILTGLRAKVDYAEREFQAAIDAQKAAAEANDKSALEAADIKVTRAERLYSNLVELWHKVEVKIQEIKKQAGLSIDRHEHETQYAADWRTLRDMRDSMPRKIIAELERSDNKKIDRILKVLDKEIRAAVERVRDAEVTQFTKNEREDDGYQNQRNL